MSLKSAFRGIKKFRVNPVHHWLRVNFSSAPGEVDLKEYDETQQQLMAERCILVNENDDVIGSATKKDCHNTKSIFENDTMLHRAFSVLLFDDKNRLLLQQRSNFKITFPNCWTNTCCSHPLYTNNQCETLMLENKTENNNNNNNGNNIIDINTARVTGAKNAAIARLNYELGINDLNESDINFLTRILYKAKMDDKWSEYELDYILICKKNVELNVSENEVSNIQYCDKNDLCRLMQDGDTIMSPWFRLLFESNMLSKWWDNLENITNGDYSIDWKIHNFNDESYMRKQ